MLIVFIGGYTFSKYSANIEGGGNAEIAKWIFNGVFEEQATEIKLSNTVEKDTLVNGKIAPGTSGKFNVLVDATGSEVSLEYFAGIKNEVNKPENMKFKISGADTVYDSLEQLFHEEVHGTISAGAENKRVIIPIEWFWPFETPIEGVDTDEIDTRSGTGTLTYSFSVSIVGKQIS